jgi:TonB-dependent starch-binding outer membrane protein SusC
MEKFKKTWKTLLFFILVTIPLAIAGQTVKGTVRDASTGEPLIGVTIRSLSEKAMAVTDINGNYNVNVSGKDRLKFSYVGYDELVVAVNGQKVLNVNIKPNQNSLNEVVVIGYGTQRKADLTGAVGVVDLQQAKKTAATNIYEMLQGQVPGVSVSTTSQPGAMSNVMIRGIGSFNTVGPLYVLDGMIVNDVNHLNPTEIESMQVLKDASAAAIYGARGANGVILITTKKGKKGKPSLDVSATFSVADMPKRIEMKNTTDFMYYNEQAYLNANTNWCAANYAASNVGKYIPNTDWQKAVFKTGFTQDYNVMYTEGSDNVNFALGAGYMDQTGVMEGPEYQRFTTRLNTDATYGIMKIGVNSTFQNAVNHGTNSGSFANALSMPTVIPVYDPDEPSKKGGYGYGSSDFPTYSSNPIAIQDSYKSLTVDNRAIANAYLELKPLKCLTYKLNVGVDAWFGRHKYINYCYTMRMASGETRYDDVLTEDRDQRITTILENTLTYQNTFGKHHITAMIGQTAEDVNWHWLMNQGYNQKVDGLWEINLAGTQNDMEGSEQERRQISYIGRMDYNYADRYLFQFNFRSDGSSKFGTNNRRGYFPSFSAGWRVSEEKFWEPYKDIVDYLKLRASWGKVGDMQSLGNYSYIPSIDHSGPYEGLYAVFGPSGSENIHNGATQTSKVNVDLGWETKTTTNFGMDFNLLHSKIFGTIEWFNSKSTDLLLNVPQSWATGISTLWTNYGSMRNRGMELTLGWHDHKGSFDYSISANVSTLRNKVLKMGDAYVQEGYTRTEVGRSVSDFYLLKTNGIFQSMDDIYNYTTTLADGTVKVIQPNAQPGDVRYVDVNGDGKIDDTDKDWCGSPLPKFEIGFNVSLAYKDFDFNMLWAGKFGNKIYNQVRANTLNFSVDNIPEDVNPWTWDNPSNEYPRMYANSTDNNKASDRFLENGSYFRLKNIQLGYSLPLSVVKKIGIQKLRAYVSGTNLITFTQYKGYDPDIICTDVYAQGIDSGQYPSARQMNFGLQVTF